MAYLNLAEAPMTPTSSPRISGPKRKASTAGFSALEWSVIALARGDHPSSLKKPGRFAMAMGALFGNGPNPRLTDPRLEALRRIAVLSWRNGHAIPSGEIEAFEQDGFSPDQYELLQRSIGLGRAKTGRKIHA